MNALQACQRLHLILGMGSRGNTAKPGTVPTSMAGQVDELAELVQWFIMAWTNFQTMQNWGWLIQRGTLAFGAGVASVQPKTTQLPNYREWMPFVGTDAGGGRKYVLSYITSAGATSVQQPVYFLEYQAFRGLFDRQVVATGRPTYFTIGPDQTWYVYPTPDVSYTFIVEYLSKPQILTTSDDAVKLEDHPGAANSGVGLPAEFHEIVVWLAARYWAETRNKADLYAVANNRVRELLIPIRQRYLPTAFC